MKVKITLIRSTIGRKQKHKATVHALGLSKINSSVVQEVNPMISGMIRTVRYLLAVEEYK